MKHAPAFLALVEGVMPSIREVTREEMLKSQESFRLIDVREDHEWQAGHIPNAMHLGRGIIERDIENLVPDKAEKLVLYCGGGYRSALCAHNLQLMGYTNVFSLKGGWREWCENTR